MSDITLTCPNCNKTIDAPTEMAGQTGECPYCDQPIIIPGKPAAPVAQTSFSFNDIEYPVIINSSPRAVFANITGLVVRWIALMIFTIISTVLLPWPWLGKVLCLGIIIFAPIDLIRILIKIKRLKQTEFRIYRNKIEASSYLFRFMGTSNNIISLNQIRQIRSNTNSLLDLWFFDCGSVTITVAGDLTDMKLTNLYQPGNTRVIIESIAFGEDSVDLNTSYVSEAE